MKIMHVMAGGRAGGAEMAYVDLCIAQYRAGWDVTAVCRPNDQRNPLMRDAGVTVYELPFGGIFDFRTKREMKNIIREHKPDIVQCWMSRAAKKCPNPSPDLPPFTKIARLGGYYNMKYYKGVEHFIGNTPDIRRWLVEDQGVSNDNASYINNFAEFAPVEKPLNRADLQTSDSDFVFLAMARLHPVKGLDTALQALKDVPNATLWIAGDGPEEANLKQLAKDLDVEGRVRFLGWRTDRAELFDACDCVLFPSRFEPFGGTFAQAWGAKRPLVTTASEGPSQYVTDGQDALVTPIDDADALSKAMRDVMESKELREKLIENGYKEYQKLFTIKSVLNQYQELYAKLVKTA
jgi:glycosyltransferase involved in cell wall biosynthesis